MADWTVAEVLHKALNLEKENYAEYMRGAKEEKNPAVRSMFSFLAEEEKKHIKLVRDKMAEFNVKE